MSDSELLRQGEGPEGDASSSGKPGRDNIPVDVLGLESQSARTTSPCSGMRSDMIVASMHPDHSDTYVFTDGTCFLL